jgi:nucleoside-diphosphate kinase
MNMQVTLAIIKPDAVQQKNVGCIITAIEDSGVLEIAYIRRAVLQRWVLEALYHEHQGKVFYNDLIDFMCSGPSYILTLQGPDAVADWRGLMGPTDPTKARPGTIRGDFGSKTGPIMHNAVHGSATPEAARREVSVVVGAYLRVR